MARLYPLSGERQSGETDKQVLACNDYLRMGPSRSIAALASHYQQNPDLAPSTVLETLYSWSSQRDWDERAEAFDAEWDAKRQAQFELVMEHDLALPQNRVQELRQLAGLLKEELYFRNHEGELVNLWVADYKTLGGKEFVDIVRYNSPLVRDYLKALDDLAAETGGRVKGVDLSSGGQALKLLGIEVVLADEVEPDPEE